MAQLLSKNAIVETTKKGNILIGKVWNGKEYAVILTEAEAVQLRRKLGALVD